MWLAEGNGKTFQLIYDFYISRYRKLCSVKYLQIILPFSRINCLALSWYFLWSFFEKNKEWLKHKHEVKGFSLCSKQKTNKYKIDTTTSAMYKCIVLSLFKVSEVTFNDIHCTSRTQIFCILLYMCFNALRVLHIRRTRTKSDDSVHVHKSNI